MNRIEIKNRSRDRQGRKTLEYFMNVTLRFERRYYGVYNSMPRDVLSKIVNKLLYKYEEI